ncbi:MAG: phosphate signaling complex protein PhoU [Kiritimatiellia bacterium]
MNLIFQRETDALKDDVFRLSGEVEMRLTAVLKAIRSRDASELDKWVSRDGEIDAKEVEIEEECLKILALHQPVARDLRFIIAVLKINNDLERIGDIVVNIAERGIYLTSVPATGIIDQVLQMGHLVKSMLRDCLDSLIEFDINKANSVIMRDDNLDQMNQEVVDAAVDLLSKDTSGTTVESLVQIYTIARYLERIGDHITNIAEDVAYLVNGTIIRHQHIT